ncbi:MAG TPA: MFS transporter [Bryobacteraceae bacterium]|nr:MFS transporter [Bryobacteraceae bacterium]
MTQPAVSIQEGRSALSGFVLSGLLLSFLGAILPSWGYHVTTDFRTVGDYFLCVNLGLLLSVRAAQILTPRRGMKFVLLIACGLVSAAFLWLADSPPPAPDWRRFLGLLILGMGAGLLNSAVFLAITPLYEHDRAATVNLSGTLFGTGCLITALLVGGTYYVYTVPAILILFAAIAGCFALIYSRARFSAVQAPVQLSLHAILRDFTNPGAVLFALLLFFQFGNEWSIAGWLPLFLIRRLGMSPESSLMLLGVYFAALLVGRIAAQALLKRMKHSTLLLSSAVSAMLGSIILASTTNRFGAVMGVLFVGAGFAAIYPLVVEKISGRFPYYHPGFYNGIFSLAFTGGLLAPWALGYVADFWGIQAIFIWPLLGTIVVFLLSSLILLEAKLTGSGEIRRAHT